MMNYRKFNLGKDELDELKHYLAAPISKEEQKELYDQLVNELNSESEILSLEDIKSKLKR